MFLPCCLASWDTRSKEGVVISRDFKGAARGGAQFAMAGHGRMGRRRNEVDTRSKKSPFRLLLLFGGPLFVAIVIAFIYRRIDLQEGSER